MPGKKVLVVDDEESLLEVKDLRINTESHQAFLKDKQIHLLLAKSPGKVSPRAASATVCVNPKRSKAGATVRSHPFLLRFPPQ